MPAQKELLKLAGKLRYRNPHNLPVTPGFCLRNGFIEDTGAEHESIGVGFRHQTQYADLVEVDMATARPKQPPLIQRVKEGTPAFMRLIGMGPGVVRENAQSRVNGYTGQEVVLKASVGGKTVYRAMWESIGNGNPWNPLMTISFESGGVNYKASGEDLPSSYTEEEFLRLWDGILASFKLRPGGSGDWPTLSPAEVQKRIDQQ